MTELTTIRERILRATNHFERREAIILTTFNLSGSFLEEQALPIVLGVDQDARTASARSAAVHQGLESTPCTVFYDPSVAPHISGSYRYVARPVPVRDRFFHPKLVVIAGVAEGMSWVYLAVSSANLTLSGWGRNAESFGETWIYKRRQQSWGVLDDFLSWLEEHTPLGETPGKADAVGRVRAVLHRMADRRRLRDTAGAPWTGTFHAQFYASVVNKAGFPDFMRLGRKRRPHKLRVCSPYWSDVKTNVEAFDARTTCLVPALSIDGKKLSLAKKQAAGLGDSARILHNKQQTGDRYWHMKVYRVLHGEKCYTAVGSCNFTQAGLAGETGNVEAMLVYESDADWLPDGDDADLDCLIEDSASEEETPSAAPVVAVVAYDWKVRQWRWHVEGGPHQSDFRLKLPGVQMLAIDEGIGARAGKPPPRGASFVIEYRCRSSTGAIQCWVGQVVELNLDCSSRVYGRPLSASEILDSWRDSVSAWEIGGGGAGGDGTEDGDDADANEATAFDAVNLYDFYRAMRSLRRRLNEMEEDGDALRRALLVGRPNSVMTLTHLADGDRNAPVIRYLVLKEGDYIPNFPKVDHFRRFAGRLRDGSGGFAFAKIRRATCSGVASSLMIRRHDLPRFRLAIFFAVMA